MKKIKEIFGKVRGKVVDFFKKIKDFFNRFNLINGWKNGLGSKQWDKFAIELRLSKLTVIDLRFDFNKNFRFILLNVGIEFK